jgi:SpoVK/Ycf46/Vps4 family AAA+-type ATPase
LPIDSSLDMENFVKKCPNNLSGADFYSITNRARKNASKRFIESQEENSNQAKKSIINLDMHERTNNNEADLLTINLEDFEKALDGFHATLNEKELAIYERFSILK